MALSAVQTAMNLEKQNIHPFFAKPHRNNAPEHQPPVANGAADNVHDDPDYEQYDEVQKGQKKRGRKPGSAQKKKENPAGKSQSVMERFTKPSRGEASVEDTRVDTITTLDNEPTIEEDPNQGRRKRQRTNSPAPAQGESAAVDVSANGSLDWHEQLELEAGRTVAHQNLPAPSDSQPDSIPANASVNGPPETERPVTPQNHVEPSTTAPASTAGKTTPKKKIIKVSKNGKLLSSPPKLELEATPPKKRRGRKPKLKVAPTVTIIKYGDDVTSRRRIGGKIEAILSGEKLAPRPVTPKKAPPKPSGPPKPTHPFFLGKAAPKSDETTSPKQSADSRPIPSLRAQKRSAVTPGKLKLESRGFHSSVDVPAFGIKSNRKSKQSGVVEAPWPAQGTAHVRNLDVTVTPEPSVPSSEPVLKARKLKSSVLAVPYEEDLMERLGSQLRSAIRRRCDLPQSDFAPPEDVRLPERLLTTGVDIQDEVRSQVSSLDAANAHPAVTSLFADIEHAFTAFDLGKCEPLAWVQKYAPKYASHVLQPREEPAVLKDWLQNLTVLAVSGKHAGPKAAETADSKKPPKKKRKKAQDDFIVDSDEEEEEEMIELPREEFDHRTSSFAPSSLRRARWTRNKNVVLISGPHGCGKSAMVHAVAKDLGFEIFEINSGSRRSGKDIQDKVGDMTENHLVSHKRQETVTKAEPLKPADTETERQDEAFQKEIDSGRQGTMMSFFKSAGPVKEKPKSKPKLKAPEPKKAPSSGQATLPIVKSQRQSQKQSLILFEEADILYEEDQGFWAQVTRLASQSKRPIIITCTNEALIPVDELPLAAILRISPPLVSLAADYMVVLAGHEGHVLERDAVSSLYQAKNCDLRASITELNLWCQMSVGDRKGGLEWIYQRWPPGKDIDKHGRPLRVASKGTYVPGMGFLSHNAFQSDDNIGYNRTEELLKEAWQQWGINPNEWSTGHKTDSIPELSSINTFNDLKRLDAIAEYTSAADTYCCVDMPSYTRDYEQPTDPSLPRLSDKSRLSYTLAAPVLQTDHATDFSNFDTDILTHTHLLLQRAYGGRYPHADEAPFPIPSTEEGFASAILQHKARQTRNAPLCRPDFSHAFDVLAYPPDSLPALNTSYNLTPSSFDRTFRIVVEDLAPYVRSIVASELVLEEQRIRLGGLLSEGGSRAGKRQRTTRAARTALEGDGYGECGWYVGRAHG
ncbi:P-loop containing nucleoside triphosphate hydrolase protein [Bimuria novae-zelandiae CBS 107.79]|uniref:P-loop containing nucleoside triphosphate hydrolase protein n=1 Tax=Bimuria novae-zelandiae CBS 107.79 TaxID=1447943 RepID=A0A6A5UTY2_9PLEO|nr:P-loop containing nucleoside triphosphate hydrolase protein [Bimuria novae-zelandiae CBS 107.79]